MPTINAANQDYTNRGDGWDLTGGTVRRKLTVQSGDVTITGGAATLTLGGNLTTGGIFITSGASSVTLTSTGSTAVTLPTFGVLEAVTKATRVDTNGSFTLTNANVVCLANAATGAIVYTLPTAAVNQGHRFYIKKTDSSANTITINRAGADTIDGATSQVIRVQYQCLMLVSDGTAAWFIL